MGDDSDVEAKSELWRALEKLASGKGVNDENLLESLDRELRVLRKCWGINLGRYGSPDPRKNLAIARAVILLNLEAHLRKLKAPRGVSAKKYRYAISVSFNMQDKDEHVVLKDMSLMERREWLGSSAALHNRTQKRTSGRYLSGAISQIEKQILSDGYSPVSVKDAKEALDSGGGTSSQPLLVKSFWRRRWPLVMGGFCGVALLVSGLLVALNLESAANDNLSEALNKALDKAPDYVGGRPTPSKCPPTLLPTKAGQGNSVLLVLSQKATDTACWTQSLTTLPAGATVRYMFTYKNNSDQVQKKVDAYISLAPKLALVPNSTYLFNSNNPNGVLYDSNAIASRGIVIGDYAPGAGAYVVVSAAFPFSEELVCGSTDIRSVGEVRPDGMSWYYNTAETTMAKQC